MRNGLAISVCLAGAWLGGCASSSVKPMQVVIEGGGQFPPSLAGRWQAGDGWEFDIEPDGRISSAIIGLGRVQVKPGETTTAPAREGGKATFEPGQWTVDYNPRTADLTIKITMSHVHIQKGDDILDGHSTDVFVGKASLSEGLWPVQWTSFSHYTAYTTEHPFSEMGTNPDAGETNPLTFRKVRVSE